MSVSLFRRWRSQKFSDLVGQEAVVSTLQNVLRSGDPARAYLFCGPRGTGKTSSARIFAKALNCERGPAEEPCNECSQCRSIAEGSNLDVFEIDAASHTQVDKIRDFIVEKVHFTPVAARCKVYIIDEVHKLSTSSFNALLKTLEEPPSHVVFVLATTHPHEMPSTILSRCQRYDFRPLTASETERHLAMIAKVENIELDEDAARHLARAADGSLRDALVLFEQAYAFSEGQVTREKVLDLLGGVGYEVLEEMFANLHRGESAEALRRLDDWIVRGRDLKRLAESFQDHLRMLLLLKVRSEDQSIKHLSDEERASLLRLTEFLSVGAITQWLRAVGEMLGRIREGRRARLEWEMFLVSLAHPEAEPSMEGLERRLERLEQGTPVARAGEASAATLPKDLLSRLSALEQKAVTPAASADDSRVAALEKQLAQLTHGYDAKLEELEARLARADITEKAAPAMAERPVEKPEPQAIQAPPVAPTAAATALARDSVDDWLSMPEVLVTGRIDRGGQISLLDSFAADEEEPAPSYQEPAFDEESEEDYSAPYDDEEPTDAWEDAQAMEEPSVEPDPLESERPTVKLEAPSPPREEPAVEARVEPRRQEAVATAPPPAQPPAPAVGASLPDPKEFFRQLMQQVKENDIRLHAVLADARLAHLSTDRFELAVPAGYEWHFGKIREGKSVLESVAAKILAGHSPQLDCSIGGEKAAPPKENEHEELVKRASGVFSGSSIVD